jgi:hypothetical protein
MAGESARAVAQRQRAQAARLLRSAEHYDRGAQGEEATAEALSALPSDEWRVFHDVRWPGRSRANIDHVLVGPQGVFVVDTKAWSGHVEVDSGVLRQNRVRRTKAVTGVTSAADAVVALVPTLDPEMVKPVLCLVRPEPLFGWVEEVMVCSSENIVTLLTSRARVLGPADVRSAAMALAHGLRPATSAEPEARVVSQRPRDRRSRDALARPLAGVAVCALLVLLVLLFDVPGRLGELGSQTVSSLKNPSGSAGERLALPGAGARPDLTFTAGAPADTRPAPQRLRPARGRHLIAVPMTVHNAGDQPWTFAPGRSLEVRDDAQATYRPDARITRIRGGTVLAPSVTLRPGGTARGSMVFDLPRGATIAAIELSLGRDETRTLRWTVP